MGHTEENTDIKRLRKVCYRNLQPLDLQSDKFLQSDTLSTALHGPANSTVWVLTVGKIPLKSEI